MDLEQLLQPLASSQGPCGDDLIFSSEFDEIQKARRFDDPSLSQGEWVTEVKEADWESVVRISEHLLSNQAKDLRVAAWLTEARGKLDGLPGLADGYELLGRLCEIFWDTIHPLTEEDDPEQRVGVFDWLVNQTTRLVRETPLTQSAKGIFSSIDHESARTTAKNIERNPGLAEEYARTAQVTQEAFEAALKDTPTRHFIDGLRGAERLLAAIKSLQTVLAMRMADHAPAFGPTFDALDDVSRFFRRHGREAVIAPANGSLDTAGQESESAAADDTGAAHSGGPIRSREQAIRQLQEIAAFFRRTEPHSPVAYLADKAVKWGTMPLHEWLRTVVKDDGALSRMEELLGVEPGSGQPA